MRKGEKEDYISFLDGPCGLVSVLERRGCRTGTTNGRMNLKPSLFH